jgi:nucleoside-diphosphate-sugar epimerase
MDEAGQSAGGAVLVTGVSGNLGARVVLQLSASRVVGVDLHPPASSAGLSRFESMDISDEDSCDQLVRLLREQEVRAVVHLAFVIDPVRTGILDVDRMWQVNVAGTARVMEAIAEINRHGGRVERFIFISSVSAYGPETPGPVDEDSQLAAHTLPYAVHKKEADEVVQRRAGQLTGCSTFILRPHIFAGVTMQNYLIGALRGTPTGRGKWAGALRRRGTRLPIVVPFGERYLNNRFQFVHVDDVARLIAHILGRPASAPVTILNVAGRGDALPFSECARIANARLLRLPGRSSCRAVLKLMWMLGISGVPPDALPYILGSYTMSTRRLQQYLGPDYRNVIQHTIADALADSFVPEVRREAAVV